MLHALHQISDRDQHHELRRLYTDHQRHGSEKAGLHDVVEQMIPVVRPQRHLLLAVMDRVQFPPDANPVLHPVIPIAGEIEHDQIDNKRDDRLRSHARPKIVEIDIGDIVQSQPALKTVEERLEREEKEQVQDARA